MFVLNSFYSVLQFFQAEQWRDGVSENHDCSWWRREWCRLNALQRQHSDCQTGRGVKEKNKVITYFTYFKLFSCLFYSFIPQVFFHFVCTLCLSFSVLASSLAVCEKLSVGWIGNHTNLNYADCQLIQGFIHDFEKIFHHLIHQQVSHAVSTNTHRKWHTILFYHIIDY